MKIIPFDRNIAQIGLDSGSLTIFGAVIHNFPETGEYRCVSIRGNETEAIFYIKVDKNSPVAQANIDLAALGEDVADPCCSGNHEAGKHFVVNPRGYVVFHVSQGPGGYAVHVEKVVEEKAQQKPFDSRELNEGDLFSAILIRPGTYSVTNLKTGARGEIVVAYPRIEKPYRPANPVRIECSRDSIEPRRIGLDPGQGQIYHIGTPSRIKIELLKSDDGPGYPREPVATGWKKQTLPQGESQKPTQSS